MLASSRGPCGGANVRGRDKSRPYKRRRGPKQPGNGIPAAITNPCRGRFNIGPVCGGAGGGVGGPWPSPTNRGKRPTKRDGPDHPGNRRAGCPHPAGPAASHGPAERSRPFPTNGAGRAANRENHGPYGTTNLCRGRCLHRPGDPAAARTSAGGINPAPTNKSYVSGQPDGGGICAGSYGRAMALPWGFTAGQGPDFEIANVRRA